LPPQRERKAKATATRTGWKQNGRPRHNINPHFPQTIIPVGGFSGTVTSPPAWQTSISEESHLPLPISWSTIARQHLQRGAIIWVWLTVRTWKQRTIVAQGVWEHPATTYE
jgi:hypothetical protein